MEAINAKKKKKKKRKEFSVYEMKNGCKVTCHALPVKRDIKALCELFNLNYVVTLLHFGESPERVKNLCKKAGEIKWHHIPLIGANSEYFLSKDTSDIIIKHFLVLIEEMKSKPLNIFIHCSAGVHRTGTVLYTLLRLTGETPESAMQAIQHIREETYLNCGAHRIKYAEECLVQPLLLNLNSQ